MKILPYKIDIGLIILLTIIAIGFSCGSFAEVVIIGIIAIVWVFVILYNDAKITGKVNWAAFGSIATGLAVIIALFSPTFTNKMYGPKLKIIEFSSKTPHLRLVPGAWVELKEEFNKDKEVKKRYNDLIKQNVKPMLIRRELGDKTKFINIQNYVLTLSIMNTGKMVAEKVEPLITKIFEYEGKNWKKRENWISIPISWLFAKKGVRNLVEERPYSFDLGSFPSKGRYKNHFLLSWTDISPELTEGFPNGKKYCFEVTAFGRKAKVVKYIYIYAKKWGEDYPYDRDDAAKKITINIEDDPPQLREETKVIKK